MSLKLYNTLTRKKEIFNPINSKKVNMFVCGPTVYDYSHLGHAKTYVQFDIIVKYLRYKGYNVFYLQNITDLDDKIINRAKEEKVDWRKIKDKYEKSFLKDMGNLNVNSVDKYARATDYVKEIISQVKRLIKKGYAYKISDGWYFDLKKNKDYGKLSNRKILEKNDAVSRIDENIEKKNSGDFCLWKFSKPGEPIWKAEIGEGRPGWHIEDTAITEKELGSQYDIHGGATDLIFPHHEAEIAQMESISGKKPLVKYWMHTGFLNINKIKMSKSLGNFKTIKDTLKEYSGEIIRYFIISAQYRKYIDLSKKVLDNSENSYKRLKNIISEIKDDKKLNKKYLRKFEDAMDDDFNTAKALQVLWNLLRDEKAKGKLRTIKKMDSVFGLNLLKKEKIEIPRTVKKLAEERQKFRKEKDWKKSDELRKKINELGYIIEDREKSYILKRKNRIRK